MKHFMPRNSAFALLGASLLLSAPVHAQLLGDTDADGVTDSADAFPCAPEAAAAAFYPAQGIHGTLLFEDQWPAPQVDYDFNDLSLNYNYVYRLDAQGRALAVRMTFNAQALGGVFNNGLAVSMPVSTASVSYVKRTFGNAQPVTLTPSSTDTNLNVDLAANLRVLFGNQLNQINSLGTANAQTGLVMEVEIGFTGPVALDLGAAPYDVYLFRTENRGLEIHLPEFPGSSRMDNTLFNTGADGSGNGRYYVDTSGLPYALHIPDRVEYPAEGVDVSFLYPRIVNFAASGGTQDKDYYVTQVNRQNAYRDTNGGAGPLARFQGLDHTSANTGCVQSWGLALSFGRTRSQFVHDAALAPNGDTVVTGYVQGTLPGQTSQGGVDAFVTRYDSATGAEVWTLQFGSNADDVGRGIAVSEAGDIYVSGDTRGTLNGQTTAGNADAFVMRLSPAGVVAWTRLVGGAGNEQGTAVATDANGNIFLGGGTTSNDLGGTGFSSGGPSSYLTRLSPDGSTTWLTQYATDAGSPNNFSYTLNLAVDPVTGDVITVGSERRYNVNGSAADGPFVARTSGTTGTVVWVNHIGGHGYRNTNTDQRYGYAYAAGVDPLTGNIFITGHWNAGSSVAQWGDWRRTLGDTSADAFYAGLSANGLILYNHSVGSQDAQNEFGESLTVATQAGAVYFTGRTGGTLPGQLNLGGDDYFVIAYDLAGQQLWIVQNGTGAHDEGHTVIPQLNGTSTPSSPSGNLLVIGNSAGSLTGPNAGIYGIVLNQHTLDTGNFTGTVNAAKNTWATGPFSGCSNTCGNGTQTRTVFCTDHLGNTIADAQCIDPRPATTQICSDTSGCTFNYVASAWSTCSQTCGVNGSQTRTLSCFRSDGTQVALSQCSQLSTPPTTQACQDFSSCTYSWFAGQFGQCSATCGSGVQGRTVFCERSDGTSVPDSQCLGAGPKPATTQPCQSGLTCLQRDFVSCGATGATGPSIQQCGPIYAQSILGEEVFVNNGVQNWFVFSGGTYRIEVWGAEGGAHTNGPAAGGKGSYVAGDFQLGAFSQLNIVVGQMGIEGGGGGGSFVWSPSTNQILIAAGGGGGAASCSGLASCPDADGMDGVTGPDGTPDRGGLNAVAGTNGDGALATTLDPASFDVSGAGAGFVTSGADSPSYGMCIAGGGDKTLINPTTTSQGGLLVGTCPNPANAQGGFGGGGAPYGLSGGGAGGYSGGAAGAADGTTRSGGGGGGSINMGANKLEMVGIQTGHGMVRISEL